MSCKDMTASAALLGVQFFEYARECYTRTEIQIRYNLIFNVPKTSKPYELPRSMRLLLLLINLSQKC